MCTPQNPFDMYAIMDIIHNVQPDLVVETGEGSRAGAAGVASVHSSTTQQRLRRAIRTCALQAGAGRRTGVVDGGLTFMSLPHYVTNLLYLVSTSSRTAFSRDPQVMATPPPRSGQGWE